MKPGESATQIGKTISFAGELTGEEDVVLDGTFKGSVTLKQNRLTVGPNAQVTADLDVRDLVVFGQLDGNVKASGKIELRQSAVLRGDIVAGRLAIEESATMRGRVELTGGSEKSMPA